MRPIVTIQRYEFIDAIEIGIERATMLHAGARAALREVGRTATLVGQNFDEDPGCPLRLAGLVDSCGEGHDGTDRFWVFYDQAIGRLLRDSYAVRPGEVAIEVAA